jgi:Arc/MetJ family transcription regulator
VQHAFLLLAREFFEAVGDALRRAVRSRGEEQLVEALFEFVGEELATESTGLPEVP